MKPIFVLMATLSFSALAAVEILETKSETFKPGTIIGLASYEMKVYKKRFRFQNEPIELASYMNDLRIVLNTRDIPDYKNFGVVQFIKGCKWHSTWDGSALKKELTISRDHFGQTVTFKHSVWEVDSDSSDPIYHSFNGHRFALWRWNKDPQNLTPESAIYVVRQDPPHPTIFFTDLPGSSGKMGTSPQTATNSTLDFETCLFKISDLPVETDTRGQNIDRKKAFHCFQWQDHFEFNFRTQKMTVPKDIDPICLQ